MKTYARVTNGVCQEIIPPMVIDGVEMPIEIRYTPETVAQMVDITDMNPQPDQQWTYDGVNFHPPVQVVPSDDELAATARLQREYYLRNIYDSGINMALRAIRTSTTEEQKNYAESKVVELDAYAIALERIPDQPGFPGEIIWPQPPEK